MLDPHRAAQEIDVGHPQPEKLADAQSKARLRNHHRAVPRCYAQFPALESLPKAAREPIEAFLALRDRRADASTAYMEALAGVEKAKLADATALLEHVRGGGKAAEFRGTVDAAHRDVAFAKADMSALDRLLGEQYQKTARALQGMHDQGADSPPRQPSRPLPGTPRRLPRWQRQGKTTSTPSA